MRMSLLHLREHIFNKVLYNCQNPTLFKKFLCTYLTVVLTTVINKLAVESRRVMWRDHKCLPPLKFFSPFTKVTFKQP